MNRDCEGWDKERALKGSDRTLGEEGGKPLGLQRNKKRKRITDEHGRGDVPGGGWCRGGETGKKQRASNAVGDLCAVPGKGGHRGWGGRCGRGEKRMQT